MADAAQFTRCYRPSCKGVAASGGPACIAHASEEERRKILESLKAGSPLDFARGVCFDKHLLRDLLNSAPEPEGVRELRFADFREAKFTADVGFESITFAGPASFDKAIFEKSALFNGASFKAEVSFDRARFSAKAQFRDATFNARARFRGSQFHGRTTFRRSLFVGRASFKGAGINGSLILNDAVFERKPRMDDMTCTEVVELNRASFVNGVEILELVGSPGIVAEGTAFGPSSILSGHREQSESPRLLSLRRSDIGNLLLADIDLRSCRFADAHNLDRLRLERGCKFAKPPGRWRSKRDVIAEEYQARAHNRSRSSKRNSQRKGNSRFPFRSHWQSRWYPDACRPPQWFLSEHPELLESLPPSAIANIYRDLRKGREGSKDEPGANDFYFGEMEMRKLDHERSRFERVIILSYWLVSGYGLRASRALLCLLLTVFGLAVLMYRYGFPGNPSFADALTFSAQSTTSLFHAPDRALTLIGSWLQIGLRLLGPLFIGLALLAVRGRVKR